MSVSNEFIAIIVAMTLVYFGLVMNKTRWKRMVGCGALILSGLALVMISDSLPMFLLFGATLIIGGLQLFQDVTSLITW